jgi:hypothetical protein
LRGAPVGARRVCWGSSALGVGVAHPRRSLARLPGGVRFGGWCGAPVALRAVCWGVRGGVRGLARGVRCWWRFEALGVVRRRRGAGGSGPKRGPGRFVVSYSPPNALDRPFGSELRVVRRWVLWASTSLRMISPRRRLAHERSRAPRTTTTTTTPPPPPARHAPTRRRPRTPWASCVTRSSTRRRCSSTPRRACRPPPSSASGG